MFPVLGHSEIGPYRYAVYPVKLSRAPAELRRGGLLWGEHNDFVSGEALVLRAAALAELHDRAVI